jgi:hypothetical protein
MSKVPELSTKRVSSGILTIYFHQVTCLMGQKSQKFAVKKIFFSKLGVIFLSLCYSTPNFSVVQRLNTPQYCPKTSYF